MNKKKYPLELNKDYNKYVRENPNFKKLNKRGKSRLEDIFICMLFNEDKRESTIKLNSQNVNIMIPARVLLNETLINDVKLLNESEHFPSGIGEITIIIAAYKRDCLRFNLNGYSDQFARPSKGLEDKGFRFKKEGKCKKYIIEEFEWEFSKEFCQIVSYNYNEDEKTKYGVNPAMKTVKKYHEIVFNVKNTQLEHKYSKFIAGLEQSGVDDPTIEEVMKMLRNKKFYETFDFVSKEFNLTKMGMCAKCSCDKKINLPNDTPFKEMYKTGKKNEGERFCRGCFGYDRTIPDEKSFKQASTTKQKSFLDHVEIVIKMREKVMELALLELEGKKVNLPPESPSEHYYDILWRHIRENIVNRVENVTATPGKYLQPFDNLFMNLFRCSIIKSPDCLNASTPESAIPAKLFF